MTATFTPIGVGSYVEYSAGGYTGDWIVLRNNTGQLEIISKESVRDVTLGSTTDAVKAANDYANAVSILNSKAKEYINYNYAVSARSVGATVDSIEQIDTTRYPLTYDVIVDSIPYTDTYYIDDQTIIASNSALQHSSIYVWLASRNTYNNGSFSDFCVRLLDTSGNMGYHGMVKAYPDSSTTTLSSTRGFRPVVTLRGDLRVIGGSGTQADPYVLGIPHESVPVGSYISYTGGDYEGNWVVLRDTPVGLELISKESVGDITLEGASGYANAVATLNAKSQQYVNPSYAVAGRSVGATADSIGMIDTTQYPLNYGVSGYPYTDTYYTDDETLITGNTVLRHSGDPVWLASRHLTTDSTHTLFNLRFIGADASVSEYYPYFVNNGTARSIHTITKGVRPVITLRGNVKTTGGSGTQGNPYTLGL